MTLDRLPNSWQIELQWIDISFGRFICNKASISVNGVSLTVANCTDDGTCFSIAVIPHTWANTSLHKIQVGEIVNLEADIMAKYAERLLVKSQPNSEGVIHKKDSNEISKKWLLEQGWA